MNKAEIRLKEIEKMIQDFVIIRKGTNPETALKKSDRINKLQVLKQGILVELESERLKNCDCVDTAQKLAFRQGLEKGRKDVFDRIEKINIRCPDCKAENKPKCIEEHAISKLKEEMSVK